MGIEKKNQLLKKKKKRKMKKNSKLIYLAAKGAESEGIKEAALANKTSICDAFTRPGLRSFVQEDNSCAVYDVGLNSCYIQVLLNLRDPDHIVV